MKPFCDLSLNISESEYRNNGRFHYSDIAGYMKDGFSYFKRDKKEESESLTFGSMVDCLVTQGIDEFDNKYCVEKEFSLSDNQKSAIKDLLEYGYENLSDNDPEVIYAVLEQYYKNPKSQVTKLFEEGSGYYKFLHDTKGKIAVDYQMYQDAIDVANKVLTSPSGRTFFNGNDKGVDKFYQLKFNGVIDDIPVTCMVDALYVDHRVKTIWIVDLKTTCANYEWEFPKSFVKYNYAVQARLYSTIVRQIMDSDDDYKDYKLEGFVFVYVSRQNRTPLIWTFDKNLDNDDIVIEKQNGDKIILEDFRKPLKEMYRIKEDQLNLPADISLMYGNDVIKHLKKLR